jgi:hypothetical protein
MLLLSPIIFMMHSMPVQAIDPKLSTDKFDRITNEIYIWKIRESDTEKFRG